MTGDATRRDRDGDLSAAEAPPASTTASEAPEEESPRERALAPALVAAATIIFLAPALLLGRVFFLKDAHLWFYPSRLYWRARVLGGELPLWMPELEMGMPFLADPSNGALYPLNLLLLLPSPGCVSQFLACHVLLALFGGHLLGRTLGLRPWPSAVAGAGFALGGYLLSMTWSGVYLISVAWMPLVAALFLRVARGGRALDIALGSAALGCQVLTGEVQAAALTGLVTVALALADDRPWARRLTGLARLAIPASLAAGLAMAQILPTLDVLTDSTRAGGLPLSEAQHWSFHPARLLELFVSALFGAPREVGGEYLGWFLNDEGGETRRLPWMATPYVGGLCLSLAVIGVGAPKPRARRWTLALAGLCAALVVVAFGRHTPVFALVHGLVPGANLFRYPAKYFAVPALALPLLAAAGLDALGRRDLDPRRLRLGLGAAVAVAFTLCLGLLAADPIGRAVADAQRGISEATAAAVIRGALLRELALFALLGLLLWLVARRFAARWPEAVVLAILIQLTLQNASAAPTSSPDVYDAPLPLVDRIVADAAPATPRVWSPMIVAAAGARPATAADAAVLASRRGIMNTGILRGLGYPSAYSAVASPRTLRFWNVTARVQKPAMDLFSMTHVIVPAGTKVPPGIGLVPLPGAEAPGVRAYRNETALPLCHLVGAARAVQDAETALELLPTREVLTGRAVIVEAPAEVVGGSTPATTPHGSCRVARPTRERLEVRCDLDRAAWVVCNESHSPGWTATIDNVEARIFRANGRVMALHVERGRHELSLRYGEPRLRAGAALAASSGACCLLLAVLALRKRRGEARG